MMTCVIVTPFCVRSSGVTPSGASSPRRQGGVGDDGRRDDGVSGSNEA
jgi:hypothetical protein